MLKKRYLLLLLLTTGICLFPLAAEETENAAEVVEAVHPWSLSVAYFGELLTHPGVKLSLGYQLFANDWYDLSAISDLGGYVHVRNNVGIFASLGISNRFTFKSGLFIDLLLSSGYLHSFPQGVVYQVDSAGNISEVYSPGVGSYMPSLALGIGWDFQKSSKIPLRAFLRVELFGQYPFNNGFLTHAAVQLGCAFIL